MRIAVIADIHGHFQALEAVLSDIERSDVQTTVCLGDVVSLGVQPREVIELLQARRCLCVMGNHDEPFVDVAQMALLCVVAEDVYTLNKWTVDQLSEEHIDFIRTFSKVIRMETGYGQEILFFHGTPQCTHEGILPSTPDSALQGLFQGRSETLLVGGHTHRQMLRWWSGKMIANPGSVGSVFGDPCARGAATSLRPWAEYGILDLSGSRATFEMKRVPFDVRATLARVAASDIPFKDWWARQYAD